MSAIFARGGKRYRVVDGYRVNAQAVEGEIEGVVVHEKTGASVGFSDFDHLIQTGFLVELPTDAPAPLLTDDEHAAVHMAGELANLLGKICGDGDQAQHDWVEFVHLIHGIQSRVMAQAAARAFPDRYRPLGGWPK